MLITCVKTKDRFPHKSVTVHVFVYVPVCGQLLSGTKTPLVLTILLSDASQLAVDTGAINHALSMAVVSLKSNVRSQRP